MSLLWGGGSDVVEHREWNRRIHEVGVVRHPLAAVYCVASPWKDDCHGQLHVSAEPMSVTICNCSCFFGEMPLLLRSALFLGFLGVFGGQVVDAIS